MPSRGPGSSSERRISERGVSVVIPTLNRGREVCQTIDELLKLGNPPAEIVVVDQTPQYAEPYQSRLNALAREGKINRLRLPKPHVTRAMNQGLLRATRDIVLFLDDDIHFDTELVYRHLEAHDGDTFAVVGRVIQPWHSNEPDQQRFDKRNPEKFEFNSKESQRVTRVMAGNLSVNRKHAIAIGGFDENFVAAAYRFEAEFAQRACDAGLAIQYSPAAAIYHLKSKQGGIRKFGNHLTNLMPSHNVGQYYYLLRTRSGFGRVGAIALNPFRAVSTRFHARNPWWVPVTLISEILGLLWALRLSSRGPRRIMLEEN